MCIVVCGCIILWLSSSAASTLPCFSHNLPDHFIRHPHDLSGTMKTAASTCFAETRVVVRHPRAVSSRATLRAQRPVYICNSAKTDSPNSKARAAAMAAAFVVSQALLLAGPSAAAVKTNLRGVAPDLRNPAVREERFQQQLMETEAEMGYPRANTFLRSKDVTENFLTMQVKKGVASVPSTGPAALMQGASKAMSGKRG